MPNLKQLRCSVELSGSHVALHEYGTTYSDGFVETFIAIPSQPTGFSIHLTSSGYIAPGLSMFVFIDGVYQCNRNCRGLLIPDEHTPASRAEVNLRVRQKEEKNAYGGFVGHEWRFEKLNIVSADAAPEVDPDIIGNIGTIEVVVRRCRERQIDTSSTRGPRDPFDTERFRHRTVEPASMKASSGVRSADDEDEEVGGMFGLFDGPSDEPYYYRPELRREYMSSPWYEPYNYYVERRPVLPPHYGHPPYEGPSRYPVCMDDADKRWTDRRPQTFRYYEPVPPPPPPRPVEEWAYRYPPDQHLEYWHPTSYYVPPRGYRPVELVRETGPAYYANQWRVPPAHTSWNRDRSPSPPSRPMAATRDKGREDQEEKRSRSGSHQDRRGRPGASTKETYQNYMKAWQSRNDNRQGASRGRNASRASDSKPMPGAWDDQGDKTGWNTDADQKDKQNTTHDNNNLGWDTNDAENDDAGQDTDNNWQSGDADDAWKTGDQNDEAGNDGWDSGAQDEDKQSNNWNDNKNANSSGDATWGNGDTQNNNNSWQQESGEQSWANSGNQDDKEKTSNNDDNQNQDNWGQNDTQNDDSGWNADNEGDKQNHSRNNWNSSTQQTSSSKDRKPGHTSTRISKRGNTSSPEESYIKPYWSKWNARGAARKESSDSNTGKKRLEAMFITPEEPLYTIPESMKDEKKVDHQVRPGKGSYYQHNTYKPIYLDSMDKPYAVFRFKYRSKEMLEQMLDITIEGDKPELEERLHSMSKEEIIKEFLRTKAASSKGTPADPNNADNRDTGNGNNIWQDGSKKDKSSDTKSVASNHSKGKRKNDDKAAATGWDNQNTNNTSGDEWDNNNQDKAAKNTIAAWDNSGSQVGNW